MVGNNIVNILMATLAVRFFSSFISQNYVDVVSTGVITVAVLTFGEILPKSVAKRYCVGFCLKYSYIISFLNVVLKPISFMFSLLQSAFAKSSQEPQVNEVELNHILDTMSEQGILDNGEAELINSVLDLNDKTVEDIMIPRVDLIAISVNEDIEKVKKIFFTNQYSRIPVYQDDKDHIIGILHERDFFTKLLKKQKINIKSMAREAIYVSKSMKVDALIKELQKQKVHMAIISGEYGETAGLVTMEDALEELVGEIYDEHDEKESSLIQKIDDDNYLLDGSTEIQELFDTLDLGNPPLDKYSKVSSFIYEQTEDIPEEGMVVSYNSEFIRRDEENEKYIEYKKVLYFTVEHVEDRRIITVKLRVVDNTIYDN